MTELAFSVDLEPNKDGTFDGVAESMNWYDEVIPRGTVYITHRVATDRPEVVAALADAHEIGVHVHPAEFGYDADDLAALSRDRQRELITETRDAVADAAGLRTADLTAFRAGRHKASPVTLEVLADLGFRVDASVHVRYREYMPAETADRAAPFIHESGLLELPTTYGRPRLPSHVWLRTAPGGHVTATANTLRTDRRGCSGLRALRWLLERTEVVVSMYMHPYDATGYEGLENDGEVFRERLEALLSSTDSEFVTASDVRDALA